MCTDHTRELGVVSVNDTILPAAEQAPISKVLNWICMCTDHTRELGVVSVNDTILPAAEQAPISKVYPNWVHSETMAFNC